MNKHNVKQAVIAMILSFATFASAQAAAEPNTLTDQEKTDGWKLLWDGKTSTGWKSIKAATFPEKGWEIKDGALSVLGKIGGDIITVEKFSNFELKLEFKITQGANHGLFLWH